MRYIIGYITKELVLLIPVYKIESLICKIVAGIAC